MLNKNYAMGLDENKLKKIEKKLLAVKEEVINCKKCPLYKSRTYPVIGEGNHLAKIFFVGEAPGFWEDKKGRPFCGAAGKILDELLDSAGLKRSEVYISNILKCRPPNNRDPMPEEIEKCSKYIERQIEAIKPEVICCLGRYSMKFLMEKFGFEKELLPISKIHGTIFRHKSKQKSPIIIPFYHPAVAVYNKKMKEILKRDFLALRKFK